MIVIKLRTAMEAYRLRTGERITYAKLSEITGIAEQTLSSIGSRAGYHTSLKNVEKLCDALGVPLHDVLVKIVDPPKAKRAGKKKRGE